MLQRKLVVLAVSVVVLGLAIPGVAQDWAGRGRAHGQVRDPEGTPLEGVQVTLRLSTDLEAGPDPVQTNSKGRWAVGGLKGGLWTVIIDMEGFMGSQGQVRVAEGSPTEAIVISLTRDPFASIGVGDRLLEAGDYAGARAEYQKALPNLEPGPAARLRSRIGDTYLEEGNLAAARSEYEQALAHIELGEQAHIRLQMANSYQREERYTEAREEYKRALPLLSPEGQAEVLKTVARSHDLEGNRDQAIATLERAVEVKPDDSQLLMLIADLLTRADREVEAKEYLSRLPEDVELPADMLLNIGIRFYNEGEIEEAYTHFNRAAEQNPNLAETYYYRGLVRVSRGENDPAKADFHKLLELEPDSEHAPEAKEFLQYLDPGS